MSAGMDRRTGAPLTGWRHVLQSIDVIFTTGFGARVMRRTFGSAVPSMLGKPLTPETMARFFTAVVIAIELWEPRFRVRRISYPGRTNSEQDMRQGHIGLRMDGDYRPRALQGDFTVERPEKIEL